MAKKLTISFKENKKDTALYNFINSTDDKSFYIKEALRQVFSSQIEAELKKIEDAEDKNKVLLENTDFNELEFERRVNQKAISFEDRRQQPFTYTNEEN